MTWANVSTPSAFRRKSSALRQRVIFMHMRAQAMVDCHFQSCRFVDSSDTMLVKRGTVSAANTEQSQFVTSSSQGSLGARTGDWRLSQRTSSTVSQFMDILVVLFGLEQAAKRRLLKKQVEAEAPKSFWQGRSSSNS